MKLIKFTILIIIAKPFMNALALYVQLFTVKPIFIPHLTLHEKQTKEANTHNQIKISSTK